MSDFPTAETLAHLVSETTQMMCGRSLVACLAANGPPPWQAEAAGFTTVVLPLDGDRQFLVALACDQSSGALLASAMFDCPQVDVSAAMVDDAMGEITNIVSGQLKMAMGAQTIGLPSTLTEAKRLQLARAAGAKTEMVYLEDATALHDLKMWFAICETTDPEQAPR